MTQPSNRLLTDEVFVMKRTLILLLAAFSSTVLIAGCGAQGQATDEAYVKQAEAKAGDIRAIFDKVGGKWEALTPEDKSAFVANFKDEAEAKSAWELMLNPKPRGGMPMGETAPQVTPR